MARPDEYARAIRDALTAAGVHCGIGKMPHSRGWPDHDTTPGTFLAYVKLHLDPGTAGPLSMGQINEWHDFLFQLTAVGETDEQALQFAGRAREVVLPLALSITGQAVHRIRQEAAQMPREDTDTTPTLFVATAQYRLCSTPA